MADANAPAEVAVVAESPPPAPVPASPSDGGIESIVVSVAVPETWFDAAVRAARQRDPQAAPAEVDRREEERIRGHVLELLPPISRPEARRVAITRFPVVSSRPEPPPRPNAPASAATPAAAAASPASPGSAAAKPRTVGAYIDATIKAVSEGRLGDVPREVWIALTAKCSAILAYILFRGSRAEEPAARRRSADAGRRSPRSRIDWTAVEEPDADTETTPAAPPRRMAA